MVLVHLDSLASSLLHVLPSLLCLIYGRCPSVQCIDERLLKAQDHYFGL
jgi:hypothetical protein